jgi:hypothetical protein
MPVKSMAVPLVVFTDAKRVKVEPEAAAQDISVPSDVSTVEDPPAANLAVSPEALP